MAGNTEQGASFPKDEENPRSVVLVPYRLEFEERIRGRDKTRNAPQEVDFLELLEKFLPRLRQLQRNEAKLEAIQWKLNSSERAPNNERILTAFLSCGNYGETSNLVNIETAKVKVKDPFDADMREFLILAYFPQKSRAGYVLFERRSQHGIKTLFREKLNEFVQEDYGNFYTANWSLYQSPELTRALEDRAVPKRILVKKHVASSKLAEEESQAAEWEVAFWLPRRSLGLLDYSVTGIKNFLKQQPSYKDVLIDDFEPSDTRIVVKLEGRDVKLKLQDDGGGQFRASYDVTDRVSWSSGSWTRTEKSIKEVAIDIVNGFEPL